MRYEGKHVILTESELHNLVNESVKIYLNENGTDEWLGQGIYNGVKNVLGAGKDAAQAKAQQIGTKAKNLGTNIGNTFNASRNLTTIQNYKEKIEQYLNAIEKMDRDLQEPIEQLKGQLETTLNKYQGRLTTARQNTFSTNTYTNGGY